MVETQVSVVFLILIVYLSSGIAFNLTNVEIATFTDNADEGDQELSVQLHDVETRANGWTAWSEWSSCSRSCDGGVAHQLRRCQVNGCHGDRIRHKICNMQPCVESHDFRDTQCAAYNSIPYEGATYVWRAHYDDLEPCTLVCSGHIKGSHQNRQRQHIGIVGMKQMNGNMMDRSDIISAQESSEYLGEQESNDLEQHIVIAKKADKVQDGTRCRPGSLDMCINGDCQRVGCDLRISSSKQVDICGICGGDGSSCTRTLYHWNLAPTSLCSAPCGGGYKLSHAVCQNRVSGEEVEGQLCNKSHKPNSAIESCNGHSCPPKWSNGEWGTCSTTCGIGQRIRDVFCIEERNNTKVKIKEELCNGYKPKYMEICNQNECPQWNTSVWSGCSASCGEGHQLRTVECIDHKSNPSNSCNPLTQPTATKPCSTGIQCQSHEEEHLEPEDKHRQLLGKHENENYMAQFAGIYNTQPLMQPYPPPQAERLVGEEVVPSESTFIPEDWGPCSATCGEGLRRRRVDCKIFLEFSRTIAKLPDKQCTGQKPIEEERCYMEPCSNERIDIKDDPYRQDTTIKVAPGAAGKTYTWQEQGYTHCSATCLGGVQELIVNCIRDDNGKVASPYLCSRDLKPEILIRTCNDHPCPPRWNYSDFQPCTQICGIGIQTREVNCIHEVTQGGGNTVVVPNNMCPQPQPPDRQYCNVLDCPVRWKTSDWSKCSKVCGGGEKIRKVECKQVMAQNHTVVRPIGMCPNPKPPDRKPCNTKSCVLDSDRPHIETSNTTFIQHDPKKKKLTLKVGGAATVYYGAVIKIKCPVKRFNRTKIQWAKDHTYLPHKSKKYKTSKKGALRIQSLTYRDSGTYTCVAGRSSADLALSVRPKPGEFLTSEEIQKQSSYRSDRVDLVVSDKHGGDGNPNFDDQSHERRPDSNTNRKKIQKTRLFTPTLPSLRLDINSLNAQQHTTFATNGEVDSFGNSRGHQLVANYPSAPALTADLIAEDSSYLRDWSEFSLEAVRAVPFADRRDKDDDDHDWEDENVVILGKGRPENLQFDWIVSDWSQCPNSCDGYGHQIRDYQCMVSLHNTSLKVQSNLCEDAGLETPESTRKCDVEDCPKWLVGKWTRCDRSRCLSLHTAMQKREVLCKNQKNTTLERSGCSSSEMPSHRQSCENKMCVGSWKAESWSMCRAGCDELGVKHRMLRCVWYGTKKPAGNACRNQAGPPISKPCKGPPCFHTEASTLQSKKIGTS